MKILKYVISISINYFSLNLFIIDDIPQARQELAQQLQKSHELTEKIAKVNEDDKSSDEVNDEEDETGIQPSLSDINNPWFAGGKARKVGVEEEEEKKKEEESGLVPLEAVKASKGDDGDDEDGEEEEEEDELEEDHKMLKMIQGERRRWQGGDEDDDDDEEDEEESDKSSKKQKGKAVSIQDKRTTSLKNKKSKVKKIKVIEVEDEEKNGTDGEDELLEEGLERRQTHKSLEDQEWLNRLEDESGPSVQLVSDVIRIDSGDQDTAARTASSTNVDPSKVFTVKPKEMNSLTPELVDEGEDSDGDRGRREQRMNIQQAFADDDVVDEFKEEKKAKVEKDKPKDIDLTLPGWGDWGGVGVQRPKKKRKRYAFQFPICPVSPV